MILKKAASENKKKKDRRGGAINYLWHWTGQKNVWLLRHDAQRHML